VAAGVNEEIGVRLVTGDERKTILDNRKSFAASYLRLLLIDGDSGRTRGFLFRLPTTGSDRDKFLRLRDAPDSPLVTLACARTLPQGAEVKLVWGKGIAATTGVATSGTQAIAFTVRPAFRASFTCDRVNKDAQCIPILPLSLSFTAPIAKGEAQKIRLVDEAGKAYPAKLPKDAGEGIESVTFGPGLPEKTQFRIEIPANLKDDAGRVLVNARSFPVARAHRREPAAREVRRRLRHPGARPARRREADASGHVAQRGADAAGRVATVRDTPIPGQVVKVKRGEEMQIVAWLRRLAAPTRSSANTTTRTTAGSSSATASRRRCSATTTPRRASRCRSPAARKRSKVVGIPLPQAGFYVVELASPKLGAALLGNRSPFYVRAATLVTNLGVHFKLGRESSLVWVTQLNDASPVRTPT
jgi:hypothetical protein